MSYRIKEYNPKNRALEAASPIKEGEMIMEVEPLCWAVLSALRSRFCSACLAESSQLMRCGACSTLSYCSKDCQRMDWKVHKQECKGFGLLTKEKKFKVTAEFVLLARCYLLLKEKEGGRLLEMLDLQEYLPAEKATHFQSMAVCLVDCLQLERTSDTLALLFKLASIISVNAFTIQDYLFNYEGVAIGLYYPANFINHSCRPNAVQLFDNKTLRVLALSDIEPDEEITISYLDELNDQPTRNAMLRETYMFDCGCFHCLAEKAVKGGSYRLLCQECGEGQLRLSPNGNELGCASCTKPMSLESVNAQKQQINELRQVLSSPDSKYEQLLKSFFQLKKLLPMTQPLFSRILQDIFLAALAEANSSTDQQQKNYEASYKILKSYLDNFKLWHSMEEHQTFHPLLLWKYSEAGKLAMYLGKLKKAMQYTESAVEILKKCRLSDRHAEVRDLKKRYDQLVVECRMHATTKLK